MKVFILGAGFSSPAGLPTSSEILPKLLDDTVTGLIDKLNLKVETFEELLSKIDLEIYYLRGTERDIGRLKLLKELRHILLTRLAITVSSKLDGKAKDLYRAFVSLLNYEEDAIISYNYDLILEKILEERGISYNYCYNMLKDTEKSLPIIKLHGSINHFHCDACNKILILGLEEFETGEDIDRCPECGNWLDRALIPPTLLKKYVNTAVEDIWPKALKVLQEADELYFIGYRIPDADLLSYHLFLFSLISRAKTDQRIEIVLGPKEKNYLSFRNLYKKRDLHLSETGLYFEEWVKDKLE